MLRQYFDSIYTNTPAPINVSFYHSSKTLPKNGLEEVQRRRAMDIYDEVIVEQVMPLAILQIMQEAAVCALVCGLLLYVKSV